MGWIIGIITVCGFAAGLYWLVKRDRIRGIKTLIPAILCPIITEAFCSLRDDRAFGGTKWEFLRHSATVDGDIWPWILLILLVAELVCVVRTGYVVLKKH